ncbi:MAG: GAF domain-containing protein [Ahniella sp.]|nr:GAF domain-containing protein [Ahniella sp.]
MTLLGLFARHAGIAIENARRYAAERRRAQRFALIARVSSMAGSADTELTLLQQVADAMHDMLGFPNIDIPLIDPEDRDMLVIRIRGGDYKHRIKHIDRIPIRRGIMGAAVTERRSQCVNDVALDPRYITPPGVTPPAAELAVPIILRGDVIGVINVESDRPFDELDVSSLEIIAAALAVGLENSRLFREAQLAAITAERGRLARDLHDNVTQILSSISLMAQSLPLAWKRDAVEGERRALRLHELAQTGFAELRALLKELSPNEQRDGISKSGLAFLGLERLKDHGLPGAIEPLLRRMAGDSHELRFDFGGYRRKPSNTRKPCIAYARRPSRMSSNTPRPAPSRSRCGWVTASSHCGLPTTARVCRSRGRMALDWTACDRA